MSCARVYGASRPAKVACMALLVAVSGVLLSPEAAMAKKTIRWWMGWTGGVSTWQAVERLYEKENPNVDVVLLLGDLDKFYTMATAGLMPDVWGPWATPGIRADVNRNWAVDLTPYIKRDGKAMDMADFFPGLIREFRVNGKQYSLPIFNYQDYFFYNTDLFAQAGLNPPPLDASDRSWSWDKMVLNAQKIAKTDSQGRLTTVGVDFRRDMTMNPGYIHIWGAKPYSDRALKSSVPQEVDWDSKEMVNALTKAHDLIYKQRVTKPAYTDLAGGKVGQLIDVGYVIGNFMLTKKLKWAIASNPWGVTNQGAMWPDGWRMSRVSKDKELSWNFVKFLCSPKVMTLVVSDPKGPFQATAVGRKSVFNDTLGQNIAKATGMRADDVFRVTAQVDEVNIVKYYDTICIHADLTRFLDPIMTDLWANKFSPQQASAKLQETTNRRLPELFKRWIRNIKFTGAE